MIYYVPTIKNIRTSSGMELLKHELITTGELKQHKIKNVNNLLSTGSLIKIEVSSHKTYFLFGARWLTGVGCNAGLTDYAPYIIEQTDKEVTA